MRRVAFIADRIAHWNAGTERQMLLLGTGLSATGWTVPLLVLRGSAAAFDGRWPGTVEQAGVVSLGSPLAWLKAMKIARRLRRDGFRIAHLFFNDVSVLMPVFLRLFGIRVIVSRRDMGFWYTPGKLRVLRGVRPAVSKVVANSRAVAGQVCEKEGYRRDKVAVFPNGMVIDDRLDRHMTADPSAGPVIGLLANIRPIKRIDIAIKAFARIADRHTSAELRIVGGGDASELRSLADSLGVGDRVRFTGRVENPADQIAGFSVAVLTSASEGLSNALIECMQAAKPVICSNSGGNPELVEDGVSGYLFEVGDSDSMARRLDTLLTDPVARRRMGQAARQRVTALCDPDVMFERHAALYMQLMARDDARPRLMEEKT